MKIISKYFLRGLFTFLPFALTVYVFVAFIGWSERLTSKNLKPLLGDIYVPGLGLVLAVSGICLLGFVVSRPIFNNFLSYMEMPFKNVPIVKSIYSALKSFGDYFDTAGVSKKQQVVMLKIPGQDFELIGFQTRDDMSGLPKPLNEKKQVAVFLPLSYQIGGYTIFVPKDWVTPIDIPVEVAMRSSLMAWMPDH